MPNIDSMDKSFERPVEMLTRKDLKEGDRIHVTTKNGSEYEFTYTAGMLIAKGEGHALANTFGSFKDVRVGEYLYFGDHHTSSVRALTHIRPGTKEALRLSPEASLALRVQLKLGMAGKDGVMLSAEEARVLRDLYGIAQFSPEQEEK